MLAVQRERRTSCWRVAGPVDADGHCGATIATRLVEVAAEFVEAHAAALRLYSDTRGLAVRARRVDGDQRIALAAAHAVADHGPGALDQVAAAAQQLAERSFDRVFEVDALGGAALALLGACVT